VLVGHLVSAVRRKAMLTLSSAAAVIPLRLKLPVGSNTAQQQTLLLLVIYQDRCQEWLGLSDYRHAVSGCEGGTCTGPAHFKHLARLQSRVYLWHKPYF
jgi:hypothetical protein